MLNCLKVSMELNANFWDNRYKENTTGWDLGQVSPPLKAYIDQLDDKNSSILIPGCGNCYEAEYLIQKGFSSITLIDLSPTLMEQLRERFRNNVGVKIITGDFFNHSGKYDLIFEQTFFCAINPALRKQYVSKMAELLNQSGRLVGLLFSREFENDGPPFGGSEKEYRILFESHFNDITFEHCYNSFPARMDTELFVNLRKK